MRRIVSLACNLTAIVLMAQPMGVAMTFMVSPTETMKEYYSYFSLMPMGYGNWFPIIAGVLSAVTALLMLVDFKIPVKKAVIVLLIIILLISLLSWVVFGAFSIVGLIVAVLHAVALNVQLFGGDSANSKATAV